VQLKYIISFSNIISILEYLIILIIF